jgi:hypothetical protein
VECLCLLPSEQLHVSSTLGLFGVRFRAVSLGLRFLLRGCVPRLIAWADIGSSPWDFRWNCEFQLVAKLHLKNGKTETQWHRVPGERNLIVKLPFPKISRFSSGNTIGLSFSFSVDSVPCVLASSWALYWLRAKPALGDSWSTVLDSVGYPEVLRFRYRCRSDASSFGHVATGIDRRHAGWNTC